MLRLISFMFKTAVLAFLILWLAFDPGSVSIVWRDTVIETSAAFFAVVTVLFAYAVHLLFRACLLYTSPSPRD